MTTENPTATAAPAAQPAAAPSPSPAASPAPSADASRAADRDTWLTPEVSAAMEFDPFTPAGEEVAPPTTTNANGSPAADGGQPAQPASVTQAPAQVGGTPPVQSETDRLLAENNRILNAVLSAPQPTQAGQGGEQPNQPQDPLTSVPGYEYNIPDQLVAAMASEDPGERKKATAMLVKGVAQGVHQTITTAVRGELQRLQQALPAMIAQYMQHSQISSTVESDFYGKFPNLKHDQLRPLVARVTGEIMQREKLQAWSPELRDRVGNTVIELLRNAAQMANGVPAVAAAPVVVQPQPAMFGGNTAVGSPRAANGAVKSQQDHMTDIL